MATASPPNARAAELDSLVRHHNHLYWDEGRTEIPDVEFDKLVRELTRLWPAAPVLQSMGPNKAAAKASPGMGEVERLGTEVVHAQPMLSLDKAYTDDELKRWTDKIKGSLLCMPKVDGIAASIVYDTNGVFVLAATRGDGEKGDDITANVRSSGLVPMKIACQGCEVRGEIFMRRSRFTEAYAEQFANPRNLTAGAIKNKDPAKAAAYKLSFLAYDFRGAGTATEAENMAQLQALGFETIPHEIVEPKDAPAAYLKMAAQRAGWEFEADGVVFRTNLLSEHKRLGLTSHHPKWALAYKFQGESGQARLVDITWSVSRNGTLTPVANIEPTVLSGVTVSRASLHHAGYIKKLGITRNATLLVMRRGDVIPHVEGVVVAGDGPLDPPATCPSCGSATRLDGDFLFCTKPLDCPAAVVGVLKHYTQTLDIQGLGEKWLRIFLDKGIIKHPSDLYTITHEQLVALDRMGDVLAQKILANIVARKTLPLPVFLTSLGIDDLGPSVAEVLASHLKDLQNIRNATEEEITSIHGMGAATAHNVVTGMKRFGPLMDELLKHVTIAAPAKAVVTDHQLSGKSVVFTGSLQTMDRKEAQKRVVALGGKTPGSVTKELDYLVVGEEKDGAESSKLKTARKLVGQGAPLKILTEKEFAVMVG